MDAPNIRMSLGAFLYPTGYHVAAWRDPEVPSDAGVNFAHYAQLARMSERDAGVHLRRDRYREGAGCTNSAREEPASEWAIRDA